MSGTPIIPNSKKSNPATAPIEKQGVTEGYPNCGCNPNVYHGEMNVKEKIPYENLKRGYSSTVSGRVLLGLLDYCRDNKVSPGKAIAELVEFRLVQLGKLPSWWFERKRL